MSPNVRPAEGVRLARQFPGLVKVPGEDSLPCAFTKPRRLDRQKHQRTQIGSAT